MMQRILPGYDKICSPIKLQTLHLTKEVDRPQAFLYDESSDAGTVVENSLNDYAEPDHFGIVETY